VRPRWGFLTASLFASILLSSSACQEIYYLRLENRVLREQLGGRHHVSSVGATRAPRPVDGLCSIQWRNTTLVEVTNHMALGDEKGATASFPGCWLSSREGRRRAIPATGDAASLNDVLRAVPAGFQLKAGPYLMKSGAVSRGEAIASRRGSRPLDEQRPLDRRCFGSAKRHHAVAGGRHRERRMVKTNPPLLGGAAQHCSGIGS
jgi:hypothetical protein